MKRCRRLATPEPAHSDRRAKYRTPPWKKCGARQKRFANLFDMFRVMRDDTPHLNEQVFRGSRRGLRHT
jgi:hypothetical protein